VSGIFGYIGRRHPSEVLLRGLREVQHKGYDACGIAIVSCGETKIVRAVGGVSHLETKLKQAEPIGKELAWGIGETLWVTRARPSERNAPPHQDCTGQFIVVQNGIVENLPELKGRLASEGHHFQTEADTEVLAHLIESRFKGDLFKAVQAILQEIKGSFAILAICTAGSSQLVAAQLGSPLMIGIGQNENFIASDVLALLPFTSQIIPLSEGESATISNQSVKLIAFDGSPVLRDAEHIAWSADSAGLKGYRHYMSKEIFEQPDVIRDTLRGRADITKGVTLEYEIGPAEIFRSMKHVVIVGCGSSRHAALVGEFLSKASPAFTWMWIMLQSSDTATLCWARIPWSLVSRSPGKQPTHSQQCSGLAIKVPLYFRSATSPEVRLLERRTPRSTPVPVRKLPCLQRKHSPRNWLFFICLDFSSPALEPL